jgi:flagella basal body P-ring formation protein FlgA
VKPGVTAWLVSENQGMRITQTVMPMARARAGEMVRVSDPLTHQILLAQVSGERLLRPASVSLGSNPERVK